MGVHDEFGGVIGRDWRESTPVAARARSARGRAQRGVHRARRRRLRAARLLRLRHRHARTSTRLAAGGVRLANFHTTALCSPTRVVPAHRPQPPLATAWAGSPTSRSGFPGYCGRHPARERLPLRDPRARTATRPTRSASGTSRPRTRPTWPRDRSTLAARPRLRPLVRVPRRRDPPVRAHALPRQPLGAAAAHRRRGLPPQRGPRRPRDRVPRRPAQRRRRPAVLPLLRDRRVPLAAPRAAGVDRALPRAVRRRLGRVARAHVRAPARGGHRCPPAPSCRRGRTGCRRGTTSTPEDQAVAARFMECFAGVPLARRRADRPGARASSSELGELDNTIDRARVRQRRERRGRRDAARSTTSALVERRSRPVARELRDRIDELGGPTAAQQLPVGLDHGRQHAVPALEARGPRGRRRRSVHRALAGAASPRRGGRSGTSSRTPSTCCPRSSSSIGVDAPGRDRRRRADARSRARASRYLLDDAATRPSGTPPSTSRCSAAAAIYHDGLEGGDVQAARRHVRRRPRPRRALRRRRVGAVPRRRRPVRGARPRRRRARAARRDGRPLVGGGARATRCSRSTTASVAAILNPRPRRILQRDRYVYVPYGAPVPESVAVERAQPVARDHRATSTSPTAIAPTACCSRSGCVLGGWSFHVLDGRLRYVHNLYGKALDVVASDVGASAPGAHELAFRFEQGRRRRRHRRRCSSTARSSARRESRASRRRATTTPAPG